VPRRRFIPVKTTNDLLIIRSDVYEMDEDFVAEPVSERAGQLPLIDLDPPFYGRLDRFDAHFPAGPPSLRQCERLTVRGDVTFGERVVVRGAVELDADEPRTIPDGSVLEG
jgi:UTP--glucose-1-phosphate uridylyltransferase